MGRDIEINTDFEKLLTQLGAVGRSQVPFAAALTIKELSTIGRDAARAQPPKVFDLKNKSLPNTIRAFTPSLTALKKDWPNQEATIAMINGGSIESLAPRQEFGGVRQAKGKRLAIPGKTIKRGPRGVPKSKRPGRIISQIEKNDANSLANGGKKRRKGKPKPFWAKSKAGNDIIAVRRSRESDSPIDVLYTFVKKTKAIKPVFDFRETIEHSIKGRYEKEFGKALRKAIATAR